MKDEQVKSQPPQDGNVPKTSACEGYRPFPNWLRTKDHTEPGFAEGRTPRRRAVLVVHGIGAQKPYETLDQFARGLLGYYRDEPGQPGPGAPSNPGPKKAGNPFPNQEILLRQHKANPNTNQQD